MKHLLSIIIAIIASLTAWADKANDAKPAPAITFKEVTHDFGVINEADGWVEHEFEYTNSGSAPLAIATVSTSCGCTKPEFSPKPLAPGKSAKIKLRFTPAGLQGDFVRTARVRTNVKGKDKSVVITISGCVIPKQEQ